MRFMKNESTMLLQRISSQSCGCTQKNLQLVYGNDYIATT